MFLVEIGYPRIPEASKISAKPRVNGDKNRDIGKKSTNPNQIMNMVETNRTDSTNT